MKKRQKIITLVIFLTIGIVVGIASKYLVNSRYGNLQENNSNHIEDIQQKRQNVKIPPIETIEVVEENKQKSNDKDTESTTDNAKKESESIFEQKIQEDPKVPEYTQVDNIPKVLNVEELTTDESMKKSEVIHNNLKVETTETTTKDKDS